jgi:hypothetical protein
MHAYKIDSTIPQIHQVTFKTLKDMQAHVGGYIELAQRFPQGDVLYVDEEGLLKNYKTAFRLPSSQWFMGNGLICGTIQDKERHAPVGHIQTYVKLIEWGVTPDEIT